MTTTAIIVVIVILVWNITILYFPFGKKERAKLSAISIAVLMGYCLLNAGEQSNPRQGVYRQIIYNQTFHPQTAKAMMTAYNVTEEELNNAEMPTPIEGMVYVFLAMAIYVTPFLLNAVVMDDDDDKTTEKVSGVLLILNAVACGFLLSLFYGLKLGLIPWFKKSVEKEKALSMLGMKNSPSPCG